MRRNSLTWHETVTLAAVALVAGLVFVVTINYVAAAVAFVVLFNVCWLLARPATKRKKPSSS
jgi:Flp pilus assembly protein TadB